APDALGIGIERRDDVETLLGETAVAQQRRPDVPRSHHARAPAAVQPQERADLVAQVFDVVAEAAPAERTERGQGPAHLGRGGAPRAAGGGGGSSGLRPPARRVGGRGSGAGGGGGGGGGAATCGWGGAGPAARALAGKSFQNVAPEKARGRGGRGPASAHSGF